jgi:hypothetical protein
MCYHVLDFMILTVFDASCFDLNMAGRFAELSAQEPFVTRGGVETFVVLRDACAASDTRSFRLRALPWLLPKAAFWCLDAYPM